MDKYGLRWSSSYDDLKIEMECIRRGGLTEGLSFHYEQMRRILWPELDDHRWHRLCRDNILSHKVCVLMGPGSSGKTHEASWLFLCEYFCFPDQTLVMVSSTDMRGLQLRVFGEIKMLFEKARDMHPDLPGNIVESKCAICTDSVEEERVRDMRKGVIGIPTIQNGKMIGLGKWVGVKQKRIRLIADECFPAGTMVDTPTGSRPIEMLKPGDFVLSATGPNRIRRIGSRPSKSLVRITSKDGRKITCTPEHPFFTQKGWEKACNLSERHYMMSPYETMRVLQNGVQAVHMRQSVQILPKPEADVQNVRKGVRSWEEDCNPSILQSVLQFELRNNHARRKGKVLHSRTRQKDFIGGYFKTRPASRIRAAIQRKNTVKSTNGQPSKQGKDDSYAEGYWAQAFGEGWKWNWSDKSRVATETDVPRGHHKSRCDYAPNPRLRLSSTLQAGFCFSRDKTWDRGRWEQSQFVVQKGSRLKENETTVGAWVDRVEVFQFGYSGFPKAGSDSSGCPVYNLEVEGHPSYSVNGLVVHNCQFMGGSFLSAFANLDKNEDFKAVVLGNPNDPLDPLGKAAEPLDGWSTHLEPSKTSVWKTRFMNGVCVNLIGTDSPNFDVPPDQTEPYRYLIGPKKIANTLSFFPKDSVEYMSQCVGAMKVGVLARRVITHDLCAQFGAREEVIWEGGQRTKIFGLDAAYGGDRCIGGHVEYGTALIKVNGQQERRVVINVNQPQIVPTRIDPGRQPEDNIAEWIRDYCSRNDIPPENVFHDSTGRGGLGTAIARVFSASCNPVEFGGSPSKRPVSLDLMVWDHAERQRRPIRCDEHFSKFVTELWFMVRYAIEGYQMKGLPEDVMDEMCMREWDKTKGNKIEVESKRDMKERVSRSPDLGDWLSICVEGCRRTGFQLTKLGNEQTESDNSGWIYDLNRRATSIRSRHSLNFAR